MRLQISETGIFLLGTGPRILGEGNGVEVFIGVSCLSVCLPADLTLGMGQLGFLWKDFNENLYQRVAKSCRENSSFFQIRTNITSCVWDLLTYMSVFTTVTVVAFSTKATIVAILNNVPRVSWLPTLPLILLLSWLPCFPNFHMLLRLPLMCDIRVTHVCWLLCLCRSIRSVSLSKHFLLF